MGKRGTLLKELDDSLKEIELKIKKGSDSVEKLNLFRKQYNALLEIDRYVSTYDWVGSDKNKEKIRMIRESGFDYDFIRSELNMSADALKSFLYRCNQKLEDYIGEATLSLILSKYDTVAFGLINFRVSAKIYSPDEMFLPYCYDFISEDKFDFIKFFESIPELNFLYTYSKVGFENALESINKDKLKAIMYILKNPNIEKYREEQKDFIQVLMGINMTFEEYLEKLEGQRKDYLKHQHFVSDVIEGNDNFYVGYLHKEDREDVGFSDLDADLEDKAINNYDWDSL